MIVVLPDSKTLHNGSMYSSSVTTGDFERFIARDLVAYIDGHYRTLATRESRGLVGHSMGGYGATVLQSQPLCRAGLSRAAVSIGNDVAARFVEATPILLAPGMCVRRLEWAATCEGVRCSMFERFSEAARVALFGARFEVSKSGDTSIEPAHLVMGLLHAKGGIAARLAQDAGLDADDVRPRLLSRATLPLATHIEVPFGPATKKVLDATVAEADAMSSQQITTGHLLLGLLRDERSAPSVLLRDAGMDLKALRPTVQAHAAEGTEAAVPDVGELFERHFRDLGLE